MHVICRAIKLAGLVWIALVLMMSGLSRMVLCIGANGHFYPEMMRAGPCSDPADAHEHADSTAGKAMAGSADDVCGNCVDVSLPLDRLSHLARQLRHGRALTDLSIHPSPTPLCAVLSPPITAPPPGNPPLSATLQSQRIIVMRV